MRLVGLIISLAALAAFISGVKFECKFSFNNWIGAESTYTCGGAIVSVENPATVTEIIGTHLAARNNTDVKAFWIQSHEILTKIPSGIEKFLANLEIFGWSRGNL